MENSKRASKITDKAMQPTASDSDTWLSESLGRGSGAFVGRITPAGERLLYFRYQPPGGARVRLPIGQYHPRGDGAHAFTVAQGRSKAQELAALYRQHPDLKGHLEAARARAQQERDDAAERARLEQQARERRLTVWRLFDQWRSVELAPVVAANGRRSGRKDGGRLVADMFRLDVFPAIGERFAAEVRRADVMRILDAIKANGRMRTANMVLGNLGQMFRFALAREIVEIDPTHGIKRRRDAGGSEVERDRYLSDGELQQLAMAMPDARLHPRTEAAFWLVLATACRIGELAGAVLAQEGLDLKSLQANAEAMDAKLGVVDLTAREWRIVNTKNGQDHIVHLSEFACRWFASLAPLREHDDDGNLLPWLFPSHKRTGPINRSTLTKQFRDRQREDAGERLAGRCKAATALRLAEGEWTSHDLRRTAGTLMSKLGVTTEVIHLCLNHKPANALDRIYIRDNRVEARRRAFTALGEHLQGVASGEAHASNVVALKAA